MNQFQEFIHLSRYARFLEEKQRRETWEETVTRYVKFFSDRSDLYPSQLVYDHILGMEVMPSMRALMTAGPALDRDNMAGYNCAYEAIEDTRDLDEIAYILLCGTGDGFSVERQWINKLPELPDEFHKTETTIVVSDSKIGWASGFRELISLLYAGKLPSWDLSRLRPAGSRLKTFGGRASGPGPLDDLFRFTVNLFLSAKGRKFNSVEIHDLVCKIADVVVVGGVRRSALLSLSNLTDERMQRAKAGQWWEQHGQRALANNSVAYTEKPDVGIFLREWSNLYDSKSGERGFFNRNSAKATAKATGRRDPNHEFGTNPCGEIILRSHGLCNLSEVVVRSTDGFNDLRRKVEVAAIIGTFQSTLTNFRYVRSIWKKNAEEERLLGVSLTGIMDHPILGGMSYEADLSQWLNDLKQHAIATNQAWADRLGINHSVAVTTIKPSGTVSQLVDSSSGIHPRFSKYYLRSVRADNNDPLCRFMVEKGFAHEVDVTKPDHTTVFYFPVRAPEGSVRSNDLTAIAQLEHYLIYKKHWCEHNPSITVYIGEDEWMDVGAWVYGHFHEIGGIAFLPRDNGIYRQAPYTEITKEEYEELKGKVPEVDWTELRETDDQTTGSQELACTSGSCDIL